MIKNTFAVIIRVSTVPGRIIYPAAGVAGASGFPASLSPSAGIKIAHSRPSLRRV